jgi:hypothetical protein
MFHGKQFKGKPLPIAKESKTNKPGLNLDEPEKRNNLKYR